ncbi:MAG: hypothetical protein IJ411_02495 [Oscillospiraceae bacterium]|nr:hypothetical protein [Oscillospiraceae bacterium]
MEKETNKPRTPLWIKLILLLLVAQNIALFGFAYYALKSMDARFASLETSVSQTQNIVGDRITTVSQEVEQVLTQQSSLVSDFYYTLQPAPRGKILLTLSAQLKSYSNGSAASFSVTSDSGETSLVKTTLSNNQLTANVTLPVCNTISVGLVITDQQNTQSQSLAQITNVSDCLTDHLFLTPDLQIKQQGSDLFLSGNLSLINEFGSLEEQQLDMARLEIRQGETLLHAFYFSQDFDSPQVDGQHQHILLFERIKTTPRGGEPLIFTVRARDKGNFEYLCTFAEVNIDSSGIAGNLQFLDNEFQLSE